MEIFAFKVGVGPKGPQHYLIGLKDAVGLRMGEGGSEGKGCS